MSLWSSLYTATSGLSAQSKAISSVSSNIANTSTTGYKGTTTTFESFINQKGLIDESSGGVIAYNYRRISSPGEINATTTTTNLAINGDGFLVVSADTDNGDIVYSRNGDFSPNAEGYLVNSEGYYLYGWAVDENGTVADGDLVAINTDEVKGTPRATTEVDIAANLPADADDGFTADTDIEVFDELGNSHTLTLTWTKAGDNSWTVACDDYGASFSQTVTFNSNGSLADPASASLAIGAWDTGATAGTITLSFGTVNGTDGLTQHASGEDEPDIELGTIDQDGYEPGTLSGVEIDQDGFVVASFDNGETRNIYQIPVATFANADGLHSITGSTFSATNKSGAVVLRQSGEGGAGTIEGSALEASNVELIDEFSRMIVAQQAYTAASKVVTTVDEMVDTLIGLKR